MLSRDLLAFPVLKFVLIEDTLTARGDVILTTLLKNHVEATGYSTHFFVFEGSFKAAQKEHARCFCHDFTKDICNWMGQTHVDLQTEISNLNERCVVVVDSLAQVLFRYGLLETFRIFNDLTKNSNVIQTTTVLHTDLLENRDKVVQYFEHIASLYMELMPGRIISYTQKQTRRKVRKMVEEYYFDAQGTFTTGPVTEASHEAPVGAAAHLNPENMTTFKIGLSEKDKQGRDQLVLPYLPKDGESSGGKIHYTLDGVDDWDEEDPDDDLDI